MTLQFVLDQARSGELAQLSAENKPDRVVVSYINLALVALYNKFSLESQEAIIQVHPAKSFYKLDGTDVDVTVDGLPMPADDVIRVEYGYEENGTPISINDSTDPYSILTPKYDMLQIPLSGNTSTRVSIIYSKSATLITNQVSYDMQGNLIFGGDYDIGIPMQLLEPLLHYIGYRAHGSRDGNIQAENNTHLMRFKAACTEIESLGVVNSHDLGYRDVKEKGYV